jgi:hypothetical protein
MPTLNDYGLWDAKQSALDNDDEKGSVSANSHLSLLLRNIVSHVSEGWLQFLIFPSICPFDVHLMSICPFIA